MRTICFGLLLAFCACRNPLFPELGVEKPAPPLANTSPANVLENLKQAYNNKDFQLYSSLLAPDFLFVVNQNYEYYLPEGSYDQIIADADGRLHKAWGLQKELDRHRKMFQAGSGADEILLRFTVPDSITWERWPEKNGWLLYVTSIYLEVTKGPEQYTITNGQQHFYFAPNPQDTTLWVISQWWDFDPDPAGND